MNPGELRHLVTVQKPVETQNAYGEPEVTWTNVVENVWARIMPLKGREYFAAKQVNADIEEKIVMRHRTDVTAKMRLIHNDTDEYYIFSIINDDQRERFDILLCTRSIE